MAVRWGPVSLFRTFCPPPPPLFPLTSSLHLSVPSVLSTPLLSSTPDQREKERETRLQELRQQREERTQKGRTGVGAGEVVMRKVEKSADGSSHSQVTKTDRFASSGSLFCSFPTHFWTLFKPVFNHSSQQRGSSYLQLDGTKGTLGGKGRNKQ